MPAAKKKPKEPSDKKPLFARCDVVKLVGIAGPDMLVTAVSAEPDDDLNEFMLTLIFFNEKGATFVDQYGEGSAFAEGLLQLVKPAAQVLAEAEAATKEARGQI